MTPTYSDNDTPARELAVAVINAMTDVKTRRFNKFGQPEIPDLRDIEEAITLRLERIICTAKREVALKYASNPCMAAIAVAEAFDLQKQLNEINWQLSKRNNP